MTAHEPCCEFHVDPDGPDPGSCDGGQEPCCDTCPQHAVLPPLLYWSPTLARRGGGDPRAGLIDATADSADCWMVWDEDGWEFLADLELPADARRLVCEAPGASS